MRSWIFRNLTHLEAIYGCRPWGRPGAPAHGGPMLRVHVLRPLPSPRSGRPLS